MCFSEMLRREPLEVQKIHHMLAPRASLHDSLVIRTILYFLLLDILLYPHEPPQVTLFGPHYLN